MPLIQEVTARMILDSRGNPTVEVEVATDDGAVGRAAVPSGASTGEHEAVELRDGDQAKWRGRGVSQAIVNVEEAIAPHLIGLNVADQRAIDHRMVDLDGSPNKGRIGANAMWKRQLAEYEAPPLDPAVDEALLDYMNRRKASFPDSNI